MWLALSVGNTNVASAPIEDGRLAGPRRLSSWRTSDGAGFEPLFEELVESHVSAPAAFEGLVASSVVPAASSALERVAQQRGIPLIHAGPRNLPIAIRVPEPESVGADRLVNAYAAGRLHGAPAIVVDLGTATTVDAVGSDGSFLGGAIAAGAQLGLDALADRTALLPRVEMTAVRRAIGQDTVEAMRIGSALGQIGLVRELIDRIRVELSRDAGGRPIRTIATGGHATSAWAAELPVEVVDPDLTIRGLALLQSELAATEAGAQRGSGSGGQAADAA
jgi:type III pantothenate kinase